MTGEAARALGLAAVLLAAGGCNILTPAAYIIGGQPKEPARFELEDRPTAVFVDDRNNSIPTNSSRARREIADKIAKDLVAEEIISPGNMISSRDAAALVRSRDREQDLVSMEDIGRAAGADQLIYVDMVSYRASPDNDVPRPSAVCRVKVIDVISRLRVFPPPEDADGWEDVIVVGELVSPELFRSNAGRAQVEAIIAQLIGDHVAKLFYRHVADPIGSRLQGGR